MRGEAAIGASGRAGNAEGLRAVLLPAGVTVVLWASSFPAIRLALRGYGPLELAALRYVVASAVLAVVMLARARTRRLVRPPLVRTLLLGASGFTVYNVALNLGEQTVTAGAASLLVQVVPLFTALLAAMFLSEAMTGHLVAGLVVSFVGTSLIALGEGGSVRFDPGALLVLLAALSQATYFVLQKPALQTHDALELTAWAVWAGTLLMLPAAPSAVGQVEGAPTAATVAMVYLGVFPGAVAYVTWAQALARSPAAQLAALLYAVPVVALVLSFVLLGEVPSVLTVVGGLIALAGVAVGRRLLPVARARAGTRA